MANTTSGKKRKRNSLEREEDPILNHEKKKLKKTYEENSLFRHVQRKKGSHSVSSSDDESFLKTQTKSTSKVKRKHHSKPSEFEHILSNEIPFNGNKNVPETISEKLTNSKSNQVSKELSNKNEDYAHNLSESDSEDDQNRLKEVPEIPYDGNKNVTVIISEKLTNNKSNQVSKELSNKNKEYTHNLCESDSEDGQNRLKEVPLVDTFNSESSDEVQRREKYISGTSENHSKRRSGLVSSEIDDSRTEIKTYQEPNLTKDDEEETLMLSSLLNNKVFSKNNVWIMQCPNSLDCTELVGQCLDLSDNGSCKLRVSSSILEAYTYRDYTSRCATLAVPSSTNNFSLYKVPVSGNIIIEEGVNMELQSSDLCIPEPSHSVELPQNLRVRHPLLGRDYKKQSRTPITLKKSSKKKKHARESESVLNGTEEEFEEENQTEKNKSKKKQKKKKRSSSESR